MAEEVLWTGFDDKGLYAVRANKDENGNVIHETYATKSELEGKQDVISDLAIIREGAEAGATAVQPDDLATVATSGSYNDLSDKPYIPPETVVDQDYDPESANAQSGIAVSQAIATVPEQVNADWTSESGVSQILNKPDVIDAVEYDSSNKKILFKAGETLVDEIDATDFIKDGMVNEVKIDNGNLVITFNTDAGKEDITIPLSEIFDPDNYYDKDSVNELLGNKVDKVDGKQLSTEDYTTAEKTKLAGVETGAQVNVIEGVSVNGSPLTPENKTVNVEIPEQQQADWNENDILEPSYIKNKPTQIGIAAGDGISIVQENDKIVISTEVDASTKADKVSGATDGHFAGLDANGNLTDSGSKASDFATAEQGVKADTAYQKPSDGIPATDLGQTVQDSLGRADTAVQPAALGDYVQKDGDKVLSDNNYTDAEKTKLEGIAAGAEVNVQSDWNQSDETADDYIRNKPTIPAAQVNADWDATEGVAEILHKPESISLQAGTGIDIEESGSNIVISAIPDDTKADKVSSATSGNFAGLDANGNLTDSGSKDSDFATAAQGALAATAVQPGDLATVATTGDYDDLSNKPDLGVYATKTELAGKVDKVEGKQLSTEDYTTAEKTKLSGIDTGAQVNVQSDWEETNTASDSYIKNKPQEIRLSNGQGIEITEDAGTLKISTTAVLPDDLATVATTGAYSDLNGAPAPISIVEGTGIDITESNNQIVISTDVDASTKADKVSGATVGNFAGLDANGNLTDSGSKAADFATAAQGALADTAVQDASYVHTDNNFTTAEQTKLSGIEDGAQANVQADWTETDSTADSYINNKPTLAAVATSGSYNDLSDVPSSLAITGGTGISIQESPTELIISTNFDPASKADKVSSPTNGNLAALDATGNLTDSGYKASDFKTKQTAVVDPTASGSAIEFIDTLVQNANGEITATKKSVQAAVASTSGVGGSAGVMSAADKEKLEGIESGAEVNVKPDWEAAAGSDAEILNKPASVEIVGGTGITVTEDTTNNELVIASTVDVSGKADKAVPATANNFAALNSSGNLADSGYSSSSFATAAQGALADSSIQGITVDSGSPLTPTSGVVNIDLSGKVDKVTGKGLSTNDYDNTDKATVTKAAAVIPSDATASNQLVSYDTMTAALAKFVGIKVSTGTGTDMHPDEQNPDTKTIYLVYDSSATGGDKYKEWIYSTTNTWTLIGDTTVDLSGYVQYPATHTDTHLVAFGPNESIADTGKTVADLTNSVETVSIGSGSGISPTSGTTDINIPLAANNNGAGTDGAMAGGDKVKLDSIATGAQVNTVNTVSIGSGTAIQPTSGTTDINIPLATSSVDGAMSSADKGKLDGITAGAEPNVQSDWNEADSTSDAYIANKPDIIIPQASPAAQGGISAPKYLMVVTTMPPSAQIDPDTIYLVQGTYIGT